MRSLTAIAHTYDDDEYIECFELTSDTPSDLDVQAEEIRIVRYSMEGPAARFDPVLGKNVVDILKGDEQYPVEVLGAERSGDRLVIRCGKISTRVKFDLVSPAWKLGRADLEATENVETARFARYAYTGQGVSFAYRQFTPKVEPGKRYPVVFALPGSGETGDKCDFDNNLQIADSRLSLAFATDAWQEEHPCYIVSPQFPSLEASYDTAAYEDAWVVLINDLVANGQADPERIYAATLSMGSRIIYSMLGHYPDYFAGLIINCGNPGGVSLSHLGDLPIMLTHIENDCAVMTDFGKSAFHDLAVAGNRSVCIWLYPTSVVQRRGLMNSHMSWSLAMADAGNLSWLFSQRKGRGVRAAESPDLQPVLATSHGETLGRLIGDDVCVALGTLAGTEGWSLREDARSLVVSDGSNEVVIDPTACEIVSSTIPLDDELRRSMVRDYNGDCYVRYDFLSACMDESVFVRFA